MDSKFLHVAVFSYAASDVNFVCLLLKDVNNRLNIFAGNDQLDHTSVVADIVIVCHRYSQQDPVPNLPKTDTRSRLIVLSDCDQEQVTVDALEAGAHHYFNIDESVNVLAARLRAAMRSYLQTNIDVLEVAPYKFYVEGRKVTHNGVPIHLSPRDFALAHFLFSNRNRIVYDSELMVTIWTLPSSMDSRRIDTAICRIRKKLNLYENESGWSLLRLRQVGYRLMSDEPISTIDISDQLSNCISPLPPKRDQAQPVFSGNTSYKVVPSNSTISSNSASLAINGGANNT